MPALYVKDCLVDAVEFGKVKQAIYCKRRRRRLFRLGDKLYLYPENRVLPRRRLRSTKCDDVRPIFIDSNKSVIVGSNVLTDVEKHHLALAEGYFNFNALFDSFHRAGGLPVEGQLIRWL